MTVDYNKVTPTRWDVARGGIDVLIHEMTTRTASLAIRVRAGAWDTTDDNEAVAHFLEHMMFKSAGNLKANEINRKFQELGASSNAWTWYADTNYYISGIAGDNFYKAAALLCTMFSDPTWTEEELEKERSVILEERNLADDRTAQVLSDKLDRTLFAGHPFGRSELGTVEQIQAITTEKLLDFYNKYYTTGNIVVLAAGGIEPADLITVIDEHLSVPVGPKNDFQDAIKLPDLPAQRHDFDHECESAFVSIALPVGHPMSIPEQIAIDLGMTAVGGGQSSRLWDTIREELGLAYSVAGSANADRHFNYITAGAGTSHDTVDICVDAMLDVLKDAFENGITEEELQRARIDFTKDLVFGSESAGGTVNRLGNQYMSLGYTMSVEEVEDIVNNITLDDVNSVLKALPDNFVVGTISRRSQ